MIQLLQEYHTLAEEYFQRIGSHLNRFDPKEIDRQEEEFRRLLPQECSWDCLVSGDCRCMALPYEIQRVDQFLHLHQSSVMENWLAL